MFSERITCQPRSRSYLPCRIADAAAPRLARVRREQEGDTGVSSPRNDRFSSEFSGEYDSCGINSYLNASCSGDRVYLNGS